MLRTLKFFNCSGHLIPSTTRRHLGVKAISFLFTELFSNFPNHKEVLSLYLSCEALVWRQSETFLPYWLQCLPSRVPIRYFTSASAPRCTSGTLPRLQNWHNFSISCPFILTWQFPSQFIHFGLSAVDR